MNEFSLLTRWMIPAPIEAVWGALYDVPAWPRWWRHVEAVRQLAPGDARGIGALHRFVWRTRLPYRLCFDMRLTHLAHPHVIEGEACGDLDGIGRWRLRPLAQSTLVNYEWCVHANRAWMRWAAPLLYPVFVWNHHGVMQSGKEGLIRLLYQKSAGGVQA